MSQVDTLQTPNDGTPNDGSIPAHIARIDYNPYLGSAVMGHNLDMDAMREQCPVFWNTYANGFWSITRMDDVREALQEVSLFSSRSVMPIEPDPPYLWIPEMLDPPIHTKWRQLLSPMFTPAKMTEMEGKVRARAIEMIEPLVDRGGCDFLRDFAWRYPTTIFMELFGLPVSETDKFLVWEAAILHATADEDPDRTKAYQAMTEVQEYFAELIKKRRENPQDDILSQAIHWKIDGEPIPESDMLAFCLLMFMAGLDTVSIQLSYSWYHLATHPADRARIVNEPEIIPQAIEELLRFYSFVPTGRKVTRDAEFAGCPMKAGQMAHIWIPAANRDPRAFENPEVVDFDRKVNPHIAFGAGPHRCLGSHLARRELRFAMEEWHKRIPDYTLDTSVEVVEHGGMFGIDAIALRW